jgi:protoporphyrinogen oxidase
MNDLVVIGAGPAGLAAAYNGACHGASVTVLERLSGVGGLARTIAFAGSRFDIGPHRFYTNNEEVLHLFTQMLGDDLTRVQRRTRIFSSGAYFDYPLTPLNAMLGLGLSRGIAIAASYAGARARAHFGPPPIRNFEDRIVDTFGRQLYQFFFKSYTEKVWGIPCSEITADWASQRIQGLSLATAVRDALFKSQRGEIKTLAQEFMYPRLGAGQLYEILAAKILERGSTVATKAKVGQLRREGRRVVAAVVESEQGPYEVAGRFFLSSAPLSDIIEMLSPEPPLEVVNAARALRYREHIAVNLLIEGRPFLDNWIYVHSPELAVARVANYRNFSPEMAGSRQVSPLTLEYFASPGDPLSKASDTSLISRAVDELGSICRFSPDQLRDSFVVRSEKAYPVLDTAHQGRVATIKAWLDQFENLLPIGRSGMFKYNNQDHAMATGLLASRTALGQGKFDPWCVNLEAEYLEGNRSG